MSTRRPRGGAGSRCARKPPPQLTFMSYDDFFQLTDEHGPIPTAAPDWSQPDRCGPYRTLPPEDLFALADFIARAKEPLPPKTISRRGAEAQRVKTEGPEETLRQASAASAPLRETSSSSFQGVPAKEPLPPKTISRRGAEPQRVKTEEPEETLRQASAVSAPLRETSSSSFQGVPAMSESQRPEKSCAISPDVEFWVEKPPDIAPAVAAKTNPVDAASCRVETDERLEAASTHPYAAALKAVPLEPGETTISYPNRRHRSKYTPNPKRPLKQYLLDDPGFMDYEKELCDSKLNYDNYEDFLRDTDPAKQGSGVGGQGSEKNVAPGSSSPLAKEGQGGLGGPSICKKRCTKAEARRRRLQIHDWLVQGLSRQQIYQITRSQWHVGKRQTQLYIQYVDRQFAEEGCRMDNIAHLWKSKTQHEDLLAKAMNKLESIEKPTEYASMLRVCAVLLKGRDNVARELVDYRTLTTRDQSPDSEVEQNKRRRVISMGMAEWLERMAHMRNFWRHEWEIEMTRPEFMRQMREVGHPVYTTPDNAPPEFVQQMREEGHPLYQQ